MTHPAHAGSAINWRYRLSLLITPFITSRYLKFLVEGFEPSVSPAYKAGADPLQPTEYFLFAVSIFHYNLFYKVSGMWLSEYSQDTVCRPLRNKSPTNHATYNLPRFSRPCCMYLSESTRHAYCPLRQRNRI